MGHPGCRLLDPGRFPVGTGVVALRGGVGGPLGHANTLGGAPGTRIPGGRDPR
ncbi:hypothetical protein GZL_01934 [Streptomyces sp. 769]|nr:hypothetical protein GZL_01934 [Streptomyces sp. 769]